MRYAQQQIFAFARDLVGQFSLGSASLAQVGLVEFNHDASVLLVVSSPERTTGESFAWSAPTFTGP